MLIDIINPYRPPRNVVGNAVHSWCTSGQKSAQCSSRTFNLTKALMFPDWVKSVILELRKAKSLSLPQTQIVGKPSLNINFTSQRAIRRTTTLNSILCCWTVQIFLFSLCNLFSVTGSFHGVSKWNFLSLIFQVILDDWDLFKSMKSSDPWFQLLKFVHCCNFENKIVQNIKTWFDNFLNSLKIHIILANSTYTWVQLSLRNRCKSFSKNVKILS